MNAVSTGRSNARSTRTIQRLFHLAAGGLLLGYVYAAPTLGDEIDAAVRFVVVPVLGLSGLVLWKWPRIRNRIRNPRRRA